MTRHGATRGPAAFRCVIGLVVVAIASVAGCVTERHVSLPGTPVQPGKAGSTPFSSAAKPEDSSAKVEMPKGPVARPAKGFTTASNVQVEIRPLGRLTYDGQQLPLCSPDGGFVVTQQGAAPTWPTILAESEQKPEAGPMLTVHDVQSSALKAITPVEPFPKGLLLGRAADSQGFLVELPRAGGTRWIGKVDWATGRLAWLVQTNHVNAHAVFDLGGDLVFTRRDVGGSTTSLVLRTRSGRESFKAPLDGGYAYPCAVDAPGMIYAFRASRAGLALEAIRIDSSDAAAPRLADTRQTWRIMSEPDVLVAHQMASTAPPVWPSPAAALAPTDNREFDVLVCFDPRQNRMARFDWHTGAVAGLAPKSIAACPVDAKPTPGYFCTAIEGLVFMPRPAEGWAATPPDNAPMARVLESPYVARPLATELPIFLLLGPVKGVADKVEVLKMAVGQ